MTTTLTLVEVALPPSFPPEYVPSAGAAFVAACVPGLTKKQLLDRTRALRWRPTWRALPDLRRGEIEAFDFGLTIDGVGVPLIARMRMCGDARVIGPAVSEHDVRQLSLF